MADMTPSEGHVSMVQSGDALNRAQFGHVAPGNPFIDLVEASEANAAERGVFLDPRERLVRLDHGSLRRDLGGHGAIDRIEDRLTHRGGKAGGLARAHQRAGKLSELVERAVEASLGGSEILVDARS